MGRRAEFGTGPSGVRWAWRLWAWPPAGRDPPRQPRRCVLPQRPRLAGPTTTTTGGSTSGNQAAVLNAWQSAQQTLYGYLQAPWQQDRANLVAGQTAATLWPNLANYFVDPALKSEQTFLVGVKMGQLNGPTSFDLGTPKVVGPHSNDGDGRRLYLTTPGPPRRPVRPDPPLLVAAQVAQGDLGSRTWSGALGRSPRSRPSSVAQVLRTKACRLAAALAAFWPTALCRCTFRRSLGCGGRIGGTCTDNGSTVSCGSGVSGTTGTGSGGGSGGTTTGGGGATTVSVPTCPNYVPYSTEFPGQDGDLRQPVRPNPVPGTSTPVPLEVRRARPPAWCGWRPVRRHRQSRRPILPSPAPRRPASCSSRPPL